MLQDPAARQSATAASVRKCRAELAGGGSPYGGGSLTITVREAVSVWPAESVQV